MASEDGKPTLNAFKVAVKEWFNWPDDKFAQEMKKKPGLAEVKDELGQTMLHHAILKHVSIDKVDAIFKDEEDWVSVGKKKFLDLAMHRRAGQLPLHLVLDERLSPSMVPVVEKIYEKYPQATMERDTNGSTPGWALHKALRQAPFIPALAEIIKRFLDTYPAACLETVEGNLPLHWACDNTKPPSLIIKVLESAPGAASVMNVNGVLPLHVAASEGLEISVVIALMEAYPAAIIEPVTLRGHSPNLIQFAVKKELNQETLSAMLNAGQGMDPKTVAYVQAAIFGLETRAGPEHRDIIDGDELTGLDQYDAMKLAVQRRRLRFYVKPYVGDRYKLTMAPDSLVSDLMAEIEKRETIPRDCQKLNCRGKRLMEGEPLAKHVLNTGVKLEDLEVEVALQNPLFHYALKAGTSEENLCTLLARRPQFASEEDAQGFLPLHMSLQITRTPEKVLDRLLELCPEAASMKSGGGLGEYPLETAIVSGSSDRDGFIDKLLEKVRPEDWDDRGYYCPRDEDGPRDIEGMPLLHAAIQNCCSGDIIKKILDSHAPVGVRDPCTGFSPLELTLVYDSPTQVFIGVLQKVRHNDPSFASSRGPSGQTLLHVAAQYNARTARLRKLFDFGEHCLHIRDNDGRLPVHVAVSAGASFDAVRELSIRAPTCVTEPDARGRTALQIAVVNSPKAGVVFELARHPSAHPERVRDERGRSLLQLAVLNDAPLPVIHELLEAAPQLLDEVNILDGKWPPTLAGKEVRRLALLPRRARLDDGASERRAKEIANNAKMSEIDGALQDRPADPAPACLQPAPPTQGSSECSIS